MDNMEIPDFDYFIDREKNKSCLVAGHAPTLINFPYAKFKGIYITVSIGPFLLKKLASPNYWINANHTFPVPTRPRHAMIINKVKNCTFVFSDTAAYFTRSIYDRDTIRNNIKIPWFAFDDRHFKHKKCNPLRGCCGLVDLYPERITFQEFVENHFKTENIWYGSGSAVIYSLMFAVLMGCSPIYLQGIELPLYYRDYICYPASFRYVCENACTISKAKLKEWIYGKVHTHFFGCLKETLATFEAMVNICHKRGIEIYNLSSTSRLNEIKNLPYLDYRKIGK